MSKVIGTVGSGEIEHYDRVKFATEEDAKAYLTALEKDIEKYQQAISDANKYALDRQMVFIDFKVQQAKDFMDILPPYSDAERWHVTTQASAHNDRELKCACGQVVIRRTYLPANKQSGVTPPPANIHPTTGDEIEICPNPGCRAQLPVSLT
jgi:hypothetical protein